MHSPPYVRGGVPSPAVSPTTTCGRGSKDFYVDNLLRTRTLARPVPLSPAFLNNGEIDASKRTDLKFGVNAILALDSRDKMTPPRELNNTSKSLNPLFHANYQINVAICTVLKTVQRRGEITCGFYFLNHCSTKTSFFYIYSTI